MSAENRDLMAERLRQTGRPFSNADQILDTRVYKDFVAASALRGALEFRKSSAEVQEVALHRLKNRYPSNRFKGFPAEALNEEAKRADLAITEKRKMEILMGTSVWPHSLKAILENILHSNALDAELADHHGNRSGVIPSLSEAYKKACHIRGPFRIFMFSSHCSGNAEVLDEDTDGGTEDRDEYQPPMTAPHSSNDGVNDTNASEMSQESSECSDDHVNVPSLGNAASDGGILEQGQDGFGSIASMETSSPTRIDPLIPNGLQPGTATAESCPDAHVDENYSERYGVDAKVATERDLLSEWRVRTHCVTPKEYGTTLFTQGSEKFDVYIGDPSQAEGNGSVRIELTDENLEGHVKLAKTVLLPGSPVLMFTSPRDFSRWCEVLARLTLIWSSQLVNRNVIHERETESGSELSHQMFGREAQRASLLTDTARKYRGGLPPTSMMPVSNAPGLAGYFPVVATLRTSWLRRG